MHMSNRDFDLDENRQVMKIYCDILESRLVGDGSAGCGFDRRKIWFYYLQAVRSSVISQGTEKILIP